MEAGGSAEEERAARFSGDADIEAGAGRDRMAGMEKVNLAHKLGQIREHWSPKIVGELNGQEVKLVKFQGEFVWHYHEAADEMFLVVRGKFRIEMKGRAAVELSEGEFFIVPQGVEHRPVADEEVSVLLFEPAGTLNTGNIRNERTVDRPKKL